MTPEREKGYHKALEHALDTGYAVLASGGKSTEAAIKVMEDSPLFNAGKGAALTYSGKNDWMHPSWTAAASTQELSLVSLP